MKVEKWGSRTSYTDNAIMKNCMFLKLRNHLLQNAEIWTVIYVYTLACRQRIRGFFQLGEKIYFYQVSDFSLLFVLQVKRRAISNCW